MKSLIYANANSLFDYSNGASRSLLLLLENWAASNIKVYAITSCVSDSEEGFDFSAKLWENIEDHGTKKHPRIKKFKLNNVNHILILNSNHARQRLESTFEELIYRETEKILRIRVAKNREVVFLSWGNLLLEEALFRQAVRYGVKTIFYLTNPTYLDKFPETLKVAEHVFTDSYATKRLYDDQIKREIKVVPKIIGPVLKEIKAKERWNKQQILYVNPSLRKGLQYAIELAYRMLENKLMYKFVFVDSTRNLHKDLNRLNMPNDQMPKNIIIKKGTNNVDTLLEDASIILLPSIWHESGSRLIVEGHKRGIPVIAFATGGTLEYMTYTKEDLFRKPIGNNHWDSTSLIIRIQKLLSNFELYLHHTNKLKKHTKEIEDKNKSAAIKMLNEIASSNNEIT